MATQRRDSQRFLTGPGDGGLERWSFKYLSVPGGLSGCIELGLVETERFQRSDRSALSVAGNISVDDPSQNCHRDGAAQNHSVIEPAKIIFASKFCLRLISQPIDFG